jgi:hypothetical protein
MKTKQKVQRKGNGATRSKAVTKEEQERAYKAFCEKLRTQLVKADQDDMRARYEIGRLVDAAMDKSKYGAKAVRRAAAEVGRNEDTLYQYKDVAKAWNEKAFAKLVQRKGKKGTPLAFNHLVILTKVRDGVQRRKLVTKALREAPTVKELRAWVRAGRTGKAPSLANVAACLRGVTKQAKKWSNMVRNLVAKTAKPNQEQQLDSIAGALRELRSELKSLDDAIQDQRERGTRASRSNGETALSGDGETALSGDGETALLRDVPEKDGPTQAEVVAGDGIDGTTMGHEDA